MDTRPGHGLHALVTVSFLGALVYYGQRLTEGHMATGAVIVFAIIAWLIERYYWSRML